MTTAGQIAKAMRYIDDEALKNDWVQAIVDVPGVGGGVVDRLAELNLPVVRYNGGEAPIDKERFVNARAEDYWTLRERFEQGEVDVDPDDDKLAAQLGMQPPGGPHRFRRAQRQDVGQAVRQVHSGPGCSDLHDLLGEVRGRVIRRLVLRGDLERRAVS
jgi:hypothetical protein